MTFHLASDILPNGQIQGVLSTASHARISQPTLCFSVQAPVRVLSGGQKIEGLGGFTAIKLDGVLTQDTPQTFVLQFKDSGFIVGNRAWHPQGPYLRTADTCLPVGMDITIGVKPSPAPPLRLPQTGLALVPAPSDWIPAKGSLDAPNFDITCPDAELVQHINQLCHRRGLAPLSGGSIPMSVTVDAQLPVHGYRLCIAQSVTIQAADTTGAFYGLISLLSLREVHDQIPCGTILDTPRFEWRGFMLDCVREFYPVDAICKLLDIMALLKLNRFHWHFADDEAFRVEIDCTPDLWQKSGFRGEGQVIPGVFGGRIGPTGGTYSKADVARIVAHAKALQIEVLPEIEVPAHAMALTTIRPELRDPDDTGTESSVQGYHRNAVNPALKATWDLLFPLSIEVAAMFPFGHLHLGGDELPKGTWDGSPLVDAYKETHGLTTYQDVQGHLMKTLARHLRQHNITPCAWQEAADGSGGGIGNDAILFSWTGAGPGRAAARMGHRVVMCPAQHTYFDMAQSADMDDWGANWAATYALDKAYDWDPVPANAPELADRIIGVEGTFWSEFTSNAKDFEPMIAPRILALATKGWSAPGATHLSDLRSAATRYVPFFAKMGWQMHAAAIDATTPDGTVNRVDR